MSRTHFINTFLSRCFGFGLTATSIHTHRYQQVLKFQNRTLSPYCSTSSYFARKRTNRLNRLSTMVETFSSSNLVVDHDVEKKMFFIILGGSEKAVLEYEDIGPDAVNLYHTGVPMSQRGKGIAKVIAKAALDHFASQGTNMRLTCTYLQKYFRENPLPQYKDRVLDL